MSNDRIKRCSVDFFICAAFLAVFGAGSVQSAGWNHSLELVLAGLMGAAGVYLRSGTRQARLVGLGAGTLTVVGGAFSFFVQNDYFVGTLVALLAIFRLWRAGTSVEPQMSTEPPVRT